MLCKCSGKYIDIYFVLKITCSYYGASLLRVTSQAWLRSDILEPQPGVTTGESRMFLALGVLDR